MAEKKLTIEKEFLKKGEFLEAVATKTELTKKKVEEVYVATKEVITEEIVKGRKAVVPHLFTVKPSWRPASERPGVNPATGDKVINKLEEKYKIKAKAEKSWAEHVDARAKENKLAK